MKYREQTGDANAPERYLTPDGYSLGNWQSKQRQNFKQGTLSVDKIKRLEEIEFSFSLIENYSNAEESFEKGYQETLRYMKKTGKPNVFPTYITSVGYKLGLWQMAQRQFHKNGKLTTDRIKRLEAIGFKWIIKKSLLKKRT